MADTGSEGPPNAAPATSVGGDSTPSVDAVGDAAAIAAQAGRGVHNAPQSAKYQDGGESLNVARYVVRKFLAGEGVPDDAEVTLTLHNYFYNVMHRVRVAGREGSYALRVSNENAFGRTLTNARSELAWLAALHAAQAETGVPVPRPVSTREGEYVISVAAGEGGSTRDRRCVMVEWLPGTLRYKVVTPALCEQAGRVMASLHKHVQGWAPPTWFELKPLEVLMSGPPYPTEGTRASSPPASDGTATTCAGAGGTAGAGAGTAASGVDAASGKKLSPLVVDPTPAQIEMIKQATAFSEATLAACTKAGPAFGGTIHADLHFGNMLVRDDEVIQVIDFDDCGTGPFVQDVGISLFYVQFEGTFMAGTPHPQAAELRAAFIAGYESVRPLPVPPGLNVDVVIGDAVAARELQILSFCARTDLEQLVPIAGKLLDAVCERLSAWIAKRAELTAE